MDQAIRIYLETGKRLDEIKMKAANARVADVEPLVKEFAEVVIQRAIAAEALTVHESPEIRAAIAELRGLSHAE
ncbi:MAG: hypothetical protein F6J95_023415 [Leptolyngbya sp. SIO1E4]|nr:hypothetical protein [Leptolyngbya sp. SIO1E4]